MEDFTWIFQFFGRLHPLIVHFPIGLLVIAFFLELFTIGNKRQELRAGINVMVYLGALFAVFAAFFGWLLSVNDDYIGELVEFHRNWGITTAVLASIASILLYRKSKNKLGYLPYRFGLAFTVICLAIAGHLGANLTHGEDFLSSVFPNNKSSYDVGKTSVLLAELKQLDSLPQLQKDRLSIGVREIFANNCHQCHSENKQKGELVKIIACLILQG